MKKQASLFLTVMAFVLLSIDALALEFEPTRVTVWRRGESIGGEEFLVANEAIEDYIATLKRPTEVLKGIRYQCLAKGRLIQPYVRQSTGSGTGTSWVYVQMVYALKDCVEMDTVDASEPR